MGAWFSTNKKDVNHVNNEYIEYKKVIDEMREIRETQKQNECLRALNDELRRELRDLRNLIHENTNNTHETHETHENTNNTHETHETHENNKSTGKSNENDQQRAKKFATQISTEAIKNYVDDLISNEDVNIRYLPDFVERQLYRNIFNIMLNILDHVLNNSKVSLFNHEIKFDVVPMSSSSVKQPKKQPITPIVRNIVADPIEPHHHKKI